MPRDEQPEWLESFLAVVDEQSFSAAADKIHRSQSRVSSHVAALERSVGAVLFDRRHRPVQLTDAGELYLPFARKTIETLDRGAEAIAEMSQQVRGVVVVGSHPSASAGFLVPIIAQLAEAYPNVRIEPVEGTTTALSDKLQAGTIDIAIRGAWPPQPDTSLSYHPLWQEPLVALIPAGHPLAGTTDPLDPIDLAEYPVVCVGLPGGQIEPEITRAADTWGISLSLAYHTQQPQTLVQMARGGLGLGLVNEMAARVSNTEGLVQRQVGAIEHGRVVSLWWDPKRYNSAAARVVIEHIRSAPIPQGAHPLAGRGHRPDSV
ncbi:LysR family transcriptional regulator [Citricoccus sp. NR2]|uniref:LysR family transcriptional regulator n=1 Tax=Citricoccus sp. NR2 TaxID=3004095 RepID=UPI0022DDD0F3|nr:LysR family transcriptional regulator [Citricoccus sp. NR2]WBL19375.1 LysR family transcriptional regulator [Citricoccus sp. NR2]